MKIGQIVYSLAGRDKNKPLVIVGITPYGVLAADGKERPLERPKLKNPKHISVTGSCLSKEEFGSNRTLRKTLNRFKLKNEF